MNHQYKKIKNRKRKKSKKKRRYKPIINNISNGAGSKASMATNLERKDLPKMKMKKKKNIRIQKKLRRNVENLILYITIAREKGMQVRIARKGNISNIVKKLRKQKKPLMVMRITWYCVCCLWTIQKKV